MSVMGCAKAAGLGDPPKAGKLVEGLPCDDKGCAEGKACEAAGPPSVSVGGGATSPASALGLAVGCGLSAVPAALAAKLGMRLPAAEVGSALPATLHAQHKCQHMFDTDSKQISTFICH